MTNENYLKRSAIFVSLSLLSAFFNYLYYPLIAHFLSPSAFGATQALIAILLQIGAIFSGLNLVTVFLVHRLSSDNSRKSIETLQKITTNLFIVVTIVLTLAAGPVTHFLHIDNRWYLFIVSIDLITSIPFIIAFGALQAHKRFVAAGSLQLICVLTKLIGGVVGTKLWGAAGALLGISFGQVVGMALYWTACKLASLEPWGHAVIRSLTPPKTSDLHFLRPLGAAITSIFIVNVVLALFISFDIIAVRHFFAPTVSGLYSGASTLSNAVVFVCLPLIGVLLPHLQKDQIRHSGSFIRRTLLMVGLVAVVAIAAFYVAPRPLLSLFGSRYTTLAYLLWRLGILMSLVAAISLVLQVSAFYKPRQSAGICLAGLAALITAAVWHHATLLSFVSTIMVVFATILVIGGLLLARTYFYDTREKPRPA